MKVELTKPVKGIFAQTELGTQELPTEELQTGEVLEVEGPGEYIFGQATAAVVDGDGNRFYILTDEFLEAIPLDARPQVSETVVEGIVSEE